MRETLSNLPVFLVLVVFCNGCQLINTGTEIRMEEQMFDISYENAKAEEVFNSIIHGTERDTNVKSRIGFSSLSFYSRYEKVAFNAHCNDHIKAMDKNIDLLISQKEAQDYYQQLSKQGKVIKKK
jgi:hypothetical protein